MKKTSIFVLSLLLTGAIAFSGCNNQPSSDKKEVKTETSSLSFANAEKLRTYSLAVESAIWGTPIVSVYAMREAFFRDAQAKYGDIVYWSKPADWKVQLTSPNASSYYVYFNFNTKDGPVVLDFPAAEGAGLFGTIINAWSKPLADVGPEGDDKGKGGKYIILPPNYTEKIPTGYLPVPSETFNGYVLFRAIPASSSDADREKAIGLVKKMRLYAFKDAKNPPEQKFIDMAGKLFDGVMKYDESFYTALAKMVDEEPVLTQDLVAVAQLRTLGIEKGKAFNPDAGTTEVLKKAASASLDFLIKKNTYDVESFWPDSRWVMHKSIGTKTGFSFVDSQNGYYDIEGRGVTFFIAFAAPKKLGAATFYVGQSTDADNKPLAGEKNYHLHVPANVPAKQYWAVTVYDAVTNCFIVESPILALDSYNTKMKRNEDGSVDIYFGPKAPEGKEANWIYTAPGKNWWTYFRFYGPDKALFDKTWVLPNIEEVKP